MIDNMLENKERGNSHKKDGAIRQPRFWLFLSQFFLVITIYK